MIDLCEGFELHVSAGGLPFVILLKSTAPMRRMIEASFGSKEDQELIQWINSPTNAHDIGAAFHVLVQTLDWGGRVQLGTVLTREFAPVHRR